MNGSETMNSEEVRHIISKYRTELMGYAIISIMVGHLRFFGLFDYGDMTFFASLGSIGVEIFLFLSSFGLFYSLEKSKDLISYYKRRLRIIPTYVIVEIGIDLITRNFKAFISPDIWWNHFTTNWFIPFICLMYIIFPLLYSIQKKYLYFPLCASITITAILTWVLVVNGLGDIHDVPMLMAQRFPIFAMGMLIADNRMDFTIKRPNLWLLLWLLVIYVVYWLLDIEYAKYLIYIPLSFCLILSLCIAFEKIKPGTVINFAGTYSLEIYLIHMFLMPKMVKYNINPYLTVIVIFIGAALGSYVVKKISKYLTERLL